jgi:hypothetical protein
VSGRKGASGERAQSWPGVPDHVLTPLILSVAVLFEQFDTLMGAADWAARRAVAADLTQQVNMVALDLDNVRGWLAMHTPDLHGGAGGGS